MTFIGELKRRNVFRVGVAYLLAAWIALQAVDFVLDAIAAPNWILQVFILAAVVGFPLVLIFSWVFEMTPEGIKREKDIDRTQPVSPGTSRKLDRVIIAFLAVTVVLLLADRLISSQQPTEESTENTIAAAAHTATSEYASEPANQKPVIDENSIAVLPFINMSSDQEQEYFSDGITEEILNRLASIRDLRVAARTSVFSYKGKSLDVREIAQKLGVSIVLEGSVRKSGNQVRITAQLIRASDGFHLWSEAYDRKLENIFAIQDDIANKIADALQISLGISNQLSGQASRLVNPEVYDLYLKARALHKQRGPGVLQAIDLFEQALAMDPDFAPAWAGLSHSFNVVINYVSEAERENLGDVGARSMKAAEKALQLDPKLPTALHAMANNLLFRFQWADAQDHYLRALQIDPDSTEIMEDYVSLLIYSWQLEAALEVGERMIELDPNVPIFLLALSEVYYALGDFQKQEQALDTGLSINPDLGNLQTKKFLRLLQDHRFDEAETYASQMSFELANQDDLAAMIDWLENPDQDPDITVLSVLRIESILALIGGRYDLWLESVRRNGAEWPEWELTQTTTILLPLDTLEGMHSYRADPRTKAWLSKLNLPEYWRQVGWPDVCKPMGENDFECF